MAVNHLRCRRQLLALSTIIAASFGQDARTLEDALPGFVDVKFSKELEGGYRAVGRLDLGAPVRMAVDAEGLKRGELVRPAAYDVVIERDRIVPARHFGQWYMRDGSTEPITFGTNVVDRDDTKPQLERMFWNSVVLEPTVGGGWTHVAKPEDVVVTIDLVPTTALKEDK